jgi:hypothetical protein
LLYSSAPPGFYLIFKTNTITIKVIWCMHVIFSLKALPKCHKLYVDKRNLAKVIEYRFRFYLTCFSVAATLWHIVIISLASGVRFSVTKCVQTTPQNHLVQFHEIFTGMLSAKAFCAYFRQFAVQWFLSEL